MFISLERTHAEEGKTYQFKHSTKGSEPSISLGIEGDIRQHFLTNPKIHKKFRINIINGENIKKCVL